MSDFAQYPFLTLQAVGSNLGEIAEQIGSGCRDAFEVSGLAADQARISAALDGFRSEWEASMTRLGDNIGGFGDTSTQIGGLSGQFDTELARSLSPDGSHAPLRNRSGALLQ